MEVVAPAEALPEMALVPVAAVVPAEPAEAYAVFLPL